MQNKSVSGKDLLKLAASRINEEYIFGAEVDLEDPDWHGPWDCAEFVTWVVYQLTGQLYGVTEEMNPWTGAWLEDVLRHKVHNVPLSVAYKTPGAILLRRAKGKGHIAFSQGNGRTIEAANSNDGVCVKNAQNRGFNYGILIPGVEY